jgi:hypothetical protein
MHFAVPRRMVALLPASEARPDTIRVTTESLPAFLYRRGGEPIDGTITACRLTGSYFHS